MERVAALLNPAKAAEALKRGLELAVGHPQAYMYGPLLNEPQQQRRAISREVPAPASPSQHMVATPRTPAERVLTALQAKGVNPTMVKISREVEVEVEVEVEDSEPEESLTPESNTGAIKSHSPGHGHATRLALKAEQREEIAQKLVLGLGGRISRQLGISLEKSSREVEQWLLASVLFTEKVPIDIVLKAHQALATASIETLSDVLNRDITSLTEVLDRGGYVHHKHRTAKRLQQLAKAVIKEGGINALAKIRDPKELKKKIEELPGMGRTAIRHFMREMEGVWPGIQPEIDDRMIHAAEHLGILEPIRIGKRKRNGRDEEADSAHPLSALASSLGIHIKDLEAALIRLSLLHSHRYRVCPGGTQCDGLPKETGAREADKVLANVNSTDANANIAHTPRDSSVQTRIVTPSSTGIGSEVESPPPAKALRLGPVEYFVPEDPGIVE